ncbi:transmembrane 7 superfamily member 3 isoform X2 [Ambystoma mexicanum]|uniref:transmembrane 7 superfamily member 3 isoform X2 n=1 Tax=Ambystoma mexicanum TaxID=8296 RepID=UPI0037E83081
MQGAAGCPCLRLLLLLLLLSGPVASTGAASDLGAGLLEVSVGQFTEVLLNKTVATEAVLRNVARNVSFIIFELHTHYLNATVSLNKIPSANDSAVGDDTGLLSILRPNQTVCTWYLQSEEVNRLKALAVTIPYTEKDPVPGGCNLEFSLDTDPNLYLEYNIYETIVKFAPANLGSARGATPPLCDGNTGPDSRWRLQYDVYQYFLPENDLQEAAILSHMQKMSQVQPVMANGVKLVTLASNDRTMVSFASIPGQGVIYNVVVRDPLLNTSAAYIPVHTYVCSFNATIDNCFTLGRVSTKIFMTLLAVAGLFICFFGHRFLKTVRLLLTAVSGAAGGILLVAYWWRCGCVVMCLLIVGLVLGFLLAAIVFFTPLGDYSTFHNDDVYWVTFSCITVLVPVLLLPCRRILNILTCVIVGSYVVILAIDAYLYTSLTYITLNVLKRALNSDFSRAFTNAPFQKNDFIIIALWMILIVSGAIFQHHREKNKHPFPPNPYQVWKRDRERRKTNILDPSHHVPPLKERLHGYLTQFLDMFQRRQPTGERTPLLFN